MLNSYFTTKGNDGKKRRSVLTSDTVTAIFFPLAIIYYEIMFKLSTGAPLWCKGTIVMLLVSAFAGGLVCFFSTLTKKAQLNRIVGAFLLAVLAVPYLVEYFVFKAFKIYYDVDTLVAGAADTVNGFAGDIKALLLSLDGISKLMLYFLPAIFLLFGGAFFGLCKAAKRSRRILLLCFTLEAYLIAILTVYFTPSLSVMQNSEYNFRTAVGNFGLLRGIGLDIFSENAVSENTDFEEVVSMSDIKIDPIPIPENEPQMPHARENGTDETELQSPETTDAEEIFVPTHITDKNRDNPPSGNNVIDIDFSGLWASGTHEKLNSYVASLTPSAKNAYTGIFKGKNLIMLSAEAFSAEAISPELTPTLYRLATKGINFTDYYQPAGAGTTGGEYQNIFGLLPMAGGKSFKNTAKQYNYYTMGSQLDRLGYYGKVFHNNDYKYYDRHLTHINLGYSDGFMGYGNGMEAYVKKCWPQSDYEMIAGTLPTYIDKQPFNIYYMTVSGHGVYSKSANAMSKKHWDKVAHLECSEAVKGYYASQIELDSALEYLVSELEMAGIADDTVICISSDHFPYGLEDNELSELYGYNATDNFRRDHSRLILWCGELEKYDPIIVSSPTFSLDILPTLSNLFGTEFDSRLMVGRDVFSDAPALVFNTAYEWKTDYGTYVGGKFTPTYDSVELPENYVKSIKSIVSNKILYCKNAPGSDYFGYLFKK